MGYMDVNADESQYVLFLFLIVKIRFELKPFITEQLIMSKIDFLKKKKLVLVKTVMNSEMSLMLILISCSYVLGLQL